ncbi:MAG: nuclease-related domain-containing protein [Clostridium sp.]
MDIILTVIFLIILFKLSKTKAEKIGEEGERRVNKKLNKLKGYTVLKNILLKTDYGTTQIDHILIGPKGIFVIETKNYSGWIYGGEWDDTWTQIIYGKKTKFRNPVKQNYGHIMAVKKVLGYKYSKEVYSIIIFSDKCKLKKTHKNVIHEKKIKSFIRKFKCKNFLALEEIQSIVDKLEKANIEGKRARVKHIKQLKKYSS